MKIAIASDHGGYYLKEAVKSHLQEKGIQTADFGTYSQESCDYPDFAYKAAKSVADGECDFAIVVCTTGIGVSMTANKVKGVRCALCCNEDSALMTRRHNDANALALGAKYLDMQTALSIVDVFLSTEFEGGRHSNRVNKITEIENL
ncbi:MAG: ribose 5-phosphate isomerase B [Corallococcus sp.]|nr:ribose 5-phosphate isomerase B [Corallococcus sp.]